MKFEEVKFEGSAASYPNIAVYGTGNTQESIGWLEYRDGDTNGHKKGYFFRPRMDDPRALSYRTLFQIVTRLGRLNRQIEDGVL